MNYNTDRTQYVVFSRIREFRAGRVEQRESMHCLRGTPLGLCLRVIVNEKLLNFEKTTYSVPSVLLLSMVKQLI